MVDRALSGEVHGGVIQMFCEFILGIFIHPLQYSVLDREMIR